MSVIKLCMGLAWLIGWVLLFRIPRLAPARDDAAPPADGPDGPPAKAVTIIIPARNEASSLPNILGDLAAQRPAGCRVIVVDDGSEDDTAAIAKSFSFVEVIAATALRDGWLGKTWACHTGAAAVEEGSMVFLDADVRVSGDAVARAVEERGDRGGLLTIWPYHRIERPYEHLSWLFNIVSMMATGAGSLLPPKKPQAGFGPFMVTTKADYLAVGGHEAVKGSVIEDFALTSRYSAAGLRVTNLGGRGDISFRMYPDGFRSLLEGWTKNYGSGAWALPFLRLAALTIYLTFSIGVWRWGGGVEISWTCRVFCALYAVQLYLMARMVGNFSILDALLYPLHVLWFVAVLLRSLWFTFVRKRVTWRGREISTG
jgi:4,4'-diaponeurosporenoate glycosyltransferase